MTEETGKRYSVTFVSQTSPDYIFGYKHKFVLTDNQNRGFRYVFPKITTEPWSKLANSHKDYILHQAILSFKAKIEDYESGEEPDAPTPWWIEYDKEITS